MQRLTCGPAAIKPLHRQYRIRFVKSLVLEDTVSSVGFVHQRHGKSQNTHSLTLC